MLRQRILKQDSRYLQSTVVIQNLWTSTNQYIGTLWNISFPFSARMKELFEQEKEIRGT